MMIKGFIVNNIAEYDSKQSEIAKTLKVKGRYAGGRKDESGNTIPDVTLVDGRLFIPYENGTDSINKKDILTD